MSEANPDNTNKSIGSKRKRNWDKFKHGHARGVATAEYNSWMAMKARCYNPKSTEYRRYGLRGITICQRWLDSFLNFLEDVGEKPCRGMSIHRINNDDGYHPNNCIWATPKEQANDRSSSRVLAAFGESHTLQFWCEKLNIKHNTVLNRLKRGWDVEKALTVNPSLYHKGEKC